MYIGTERQIVDPNIVSGADYDNRFNNYDNYSNFSDDPLAMEAVEKIRIAEDLIEKAKARLPIAKAEVLDARQKMSPYSTALNNAYNERNNDPNITPERRIELDLIIVDSRAGKEKYQAIWSNLNAEISRIGSTIGGNEGMSYGMKMEYKKITGETYEEGLANYNAELEAKQEADLIALEKELQAEAELALEANKMMKYSVDGVVSKISETSGLSESNTKYALIGLAVVGAIMIYKRTKK